MAEKYVPRILVVDDEKVVREITQAFLTLNGYDVNTAENGKEAFEKMLSTHYDVVITDVQMPIMGGIELLERISQIKADTVTILLTGSPVNKSECSQKPFAHLCKPFSHNQLIQVIQEGLKHHSAMAHS